MKLFTIGFTQCTAESFFGRLRASGSKRLIDVRLHNVSQLAGFAKRDDLRYFARELCGMDYVHLPVLAPTAAMFDRFRKGRGTWDEYERAFLDLMAERQVETQLDPAMFEGACLLCSEAEPHHCHRRLVADYLGSKWKGSMEVAHL